MQVLLHYEAFRREGARVTYKEFDFGHLDFTFAVRSTAASASIPVPLLTAWQGCVMFRRATFATGLGLCGRVVNVGMRPAQAIPASHGHAAAPLLAPVNVPQALTRHEQNRSHMSGGVWNISNCKFCAQQVKDELRHYVLSRLLLRH